MLLHQGSTVSASCSGRQLVLLGYSFCLVTQFAWLLVLHVQDVTTHVAQTVFAFNVCAHV